MVFVIENDQHYSVARIAAWLMKSLPVAEGDEHHTLIVRHFQRRNGFWGQLRERIFGVLRAFGAKPNQKFLLPFAIFHQPFSLQSLFGVFDKHDIAVE